MTAKKIKLTEYAACAGWASKFSPEAIVQVLGYLPKYKFDNVIVGTEYFDDAGVVKFDDKIGLVTTVDFFTPVVNEPRDFGRIAAANSLSDIYAMGGTAFSARGGPVDPTLRRGGRPSHSPV